MDCLFCTRSDFCECEVERPSSSQPGWGNKGPGVSGTQWCYCTEILSQKQMLFFGKSVSLEVLFLFSQVLSPERTGFGGRE